MNLEELANQYGNILRDGQTWRKMQPQVRIDCLSRVNMYAKAHDISAQEATKRIVRHYEESMLADQAHGNVDKSSTSSKSDSDNCTPQDG